MSKCIRLSHRPEPSAVKPCSPRGGQWIGHSRTTWSTACSSAPHSQAAEAMPHLYKQEWKRNPSAEAVKSDSGSSWEGHSGEWVPVSVMKMRSLVGLSAHSAFHWWSVQLAPHMLCCQMNWWVVVRRVQMDVSIWDAVLLHSMDGWTLSGAGVQAPWHGVLEIVRLLCDEAQQVGCLRGLKGCQLV